jgi:hypothetical protein
MSATTTHRVGDNVSRVRARRGTVAFEIALPSSHLLGVRRMSMLEIVLTLWLSGSSLLLALILVRSLIKEHWPKWSTKSGAAVVGPAIRGSATDASHNRSTPSRLQAVGNGIPKQPPEVAVQPRQPPHCECLYRVRSSGKIEIFVGYRMAVRMEEIPLLPEWIARALLGVVRDQSQTDELATAIGHADPEQRLHPS